MKRKPRHSQKALARKRAELREQASFRTLATLQLNLTEEQIRDWSHTHGGLFLRRGYDLRGQLEEKVLDCAKHANWTAFVNVAHTLVHLVPKEGDFHVRIPLYQSLKNMSDGNVAKVIMGRFWRE